MVIWIVHIWGLKYGNDTVAIKINPFRALMLWIGLFYDSVCFFVCFFSKIILAQKTKIAETFGISTIFIGALEGTRPPALQAYGSHKCSPLKAKNSPPDCFLNALTPRGFEPLNHIKNKQHI